MAVLTALRTVTLPHDEIIPSLGQGTWRMAEDPRRRSDEIAALRLGIDLGLSLIDPAEMYAEVLVGEAIKGRRDQVFLVSKVLPHHASVRGTIEACDGSLLRLGVDVIDLYLLHWRGPIPLEETLEAFERLRAAGKIGSWGVSNFDLADMQDLIDIPGGRQVSTDQVLYNLEYRGIEYDLLPWCEQRIADHGLFPDRARAGPRSPSAQVRGCAASRHPGASGARLGAAERQCLRDPACEQPGACPGEPRGLSASDFAELDYAFPPPTQKQPLAVH